MTTQTKKATLLHLFSMKFYSNRRKIRRVLEDALK